MDPLRAVIRRFDDWLSRVEGVVPFAADPRLILRVQRSSLPRDLWLPSHRVSAGSPALMVHFWNERLPLIDSDGANLAWALQLQRRLIYSFRAMARHLQQTPSLSDVCAVGGVLAHIHAGAPDGGRRLLQHLGFTIFPYYRPAGAFGEFWENFYTWMLIWTYNPASLRSHALLGLQRNEFWTTREDFLGRFGGV